MKSSIVLGVDIGGSHITAALVDLATRNIIKETCVREDLISAENKETVILTWSRVMIEAAANHWNKDLRIGIAMPGPFDYEKGISFITGVGKYEALYGLNVKGLLSTQLEIRAENIHMTNDAGCFLMGEAFGGAAHGHRHAIAITLGSGLGTATYHLGVAKDADLWYSPFLDSIAEEYLSTRWFVKRYLELFGREVNGVKELSGLYLQDPQVKVVFDEFAQNLATFTLEFAKKEKPEVIVFGGNIMKASHLFLPEVEKQLRAEAIKVPIKITTLGEAAPIIGAASYWFEHSERKSPIL